MQKATANHSANHQTAGVIPVSDRGLAYGHGVFETIRISAGCAPLLAYHLQRLQEGARRLSIAVDVDVAREQFNDFLEGQKSDGVVKLLVTAGVGGRGYAMPETASVNAVMQWHNLPEMAPELYRDGINLRCCQHRLPDAPALAGIKHLNRLDQVLARAEWRDAEIHEGLMLDNQDRVIEAVSSNIFIRPKDQAEDQWLTPNLNRSGVAGVMRRLVIEELCPGQGLPLMERDIAIAELAEAQEIFVCNSVFGIRPVTRIIGSADGGLERSMEYRVGDWTQKLQQALGELHPCYRF